MVIKINILEEVSSVGACYLLLLDVGYRGVGASRRSLA